MLVGGPGHQQEGQKGAEEGQNPVEGRGVAGWVRVSGAQEEKGHHINLLAKGGGSMDQDGPVGLGRRELLVTCGGFTPR